MPTWHVDMDGEEVRALDKIMEDSGLSLRKDLLNEALTLFAWCVGETAGGNKIAAVNRETKTIHFVSLPALNMVADKFEKNKNEAQLSG